jgi:hypothetical protein
VARIITLLPLPHENNDSTKLLPTVLPTVAVQLSNLLNEMNVSRKPSVYSCTETLLDVRHTDILKPRAN